MEAPRAWRRSARERRKGAVMTRDTPGQRSNRTRTLRRSNPLWTAWIRDRGFPPGHLVGCCRMGIAKEVLAWIESQPTKNSEPLVAKRAKAEPKLERAGWRDEPMARHMRGPSRCRRLPDDVG